MKSEARIRAYGNTRNIRFLEIAVSEQWFSIIGASNPEEAYRVLYYIDTNEGKIVPAEYRGGAAEFKEKADFSNACLVELPESLIKSGRTKIFTPISDEDLEFIRENCYRPGPVSE